jgi:anti-anti-sigma regulatory factor
MDIAVDAWLPKSVILLREYTFERFVADLIAGVTVGLVALPLAIAFAIASGVSPQAGIYCAMVTGFLISALGGSQTQIGGPTGAFVVVVLGIISRYGIGGLFTCTMLAGVILVNHGGNAGRPDVEVFSATGGGWLTFIRKISQTTTVSKVTDDYIEDGRTHILQDKDIPDYAAVYRIHGPFLFGVTDKVNTITDHLASLPPIVILRLRNMTAIDTTGIAALEELADQLQKSGRSMLLCGARLQPEALMREAGFDRHAGTRTEYQEGIDLDQSKLNGGAPSGGRGVNPIGVQRLPRDPANNCQPVLPWNFVRTNAIFGVVHQAGGYTAWSDKHPAYASVSGPSTKGPVNLDDFYAPEINSIPVALPGIKPGGQNICNPIADPTWNPDPTKSALGAYTDSFAALKCYDTLKVNAILNEIDGVHSRSQCQDEDPDGIWHELPGGQRGSETDRKRSWNRRVSRTRSCRNTVASVMPTPT